MPALAESLQSVSPAAIIFAVLLLLPNLAVQVAKWWYLLRLANRQISARTAWRSLIIGFPLGFVTPGRLGEIGRALYVEEISQRRTFGLVIVDKVAATLVTLVFGLAGLHMLPILPPNSRLHLLLTIALAGLILLATILVTWRPCAETIGRWTRTSLSRPDLAVCLLLSSLFYAIFVVQLMLLTGTFDPQMWWSGLEAAGATFLLKTILPISFGDLGIREGAASYFFSQIGVAPATALNAAFILYLINLGIPSLMGLPVLLKTRREIQI